ncbi:MarR family winged helix-turn-helix transcriptional regulator [Actinocorallia populi]|uniref:MarR family winged helix-turn-helix transcriptional regulator n=1 Tax=Actinocorallia populi TaxID=2079200 RepID=UPI001E3907DB|nr:MarR family transcriptional regulator [Actinocorallia populi]
MSEVREQVEEWRELARQVAALSCRLDKALHEHGLGMSEFEVLDRLADHKAEHGDAAGDKGLRMQQLSEEVHLTQSALSRTVARLEKDGLVRRSMCAQDRRGVFVALTGEGERRWERACPSHRAVIAEAFSG